MDGADSPSFDQVVDPFKVPPAAGLVSADGTTVQVVGNVPGERDQVAQRLAPVLPIVDAARAAMPSAEIHVIGNTFINQEINDLISHDLDASLRITLPLTFLILLLAFGAIAASVIPLVLAVTSLLAAFGLIGLYSQAVAAVSPNATQLIVLIGLAVAVDYSLFMVTRFRVERRHGRTVPLAIEIASSTAGRAVFFSGLAVMISLAGSVHARDRPLHVDGRGHDRRGPRVGPRQPDVPAGDAGDRRRPGEPRPAGDVDPARPPPAPRGRPPGPRPCRSRLARATRRPARGQRPLGMARHRGHGAAGPDARPLQRPA